MSAKRRSTVHDFSTLRLHPDGSRVAINSPPPTGLCDSRTRNTGRDMRGNRVARDAAGLGVVPKRMVICQDDDGADAGNDGDGNDDDEVRKVKPLPRKRRRIDDNVEFLGNSGNRVRRITGDTATTNWPVPSSVRSRLILSFYVIFAPYRSHQQDLLKCVHYFASQYYSARGLLSDQSRMYRREVRHWKARVSVAMDSRAEVGANADVDDDACADADDDDLSAEDVEDSEGVSGNVKVDREGGDGKGSTTESIPDMYNALDGSALMAIGTPIVVDF